MKVHLLQTPPYAPSENTIETMCGYFWRPGTRVNPGRRLVSTTSEPLEVTCARCLAKLVSSGVGVLAVVDRPG